MMSLLNASEIVVPIGNAPPRPAAMDPGMSGVARMTAGMKIDMTAGIKIDMTGGIMIDMAGGIKFSLAGGLEVEIAAAAKMDIGTFCAELAAATVHGVHMLCA